MTADTGLSNEEIAALRETFRAQTEELLEGYGRYVLELERGGQPADTLKAIQRVVHTIKGDSMSLEFEKLAELAHRLEDQLDALRKSERPVARPQIDLLLACGDTMTILLRGYCAEPSKSPVDIAPLCAKFDENFVGTQAAGPGEAATKRYCLTITFARKCEMHSAGAFLIRRKLEPLARIREVDPDPESAIIEKASRWILIVESTARPEALKRAGRVPGISSRVKIELQKDRPNNHSAETGAPEDTTESGGSLDEEATGSPSFTGPTSSEQLRMEVGKIDKIMNLVGELVIGRSMVSQALSELSGAEEAALTRLNAANNFLEQTLTELQSVVLKIRMVPVDHVFRRFPRVVRDLANNAGKNVELEIQGASTELDKSIVDALHEPLLHLVRNGIDHALESPQERTAAGKPPVGRLTLAAYYEGNQVHILIEDDGRGIDIEQIRRRAVAVGLAEPHEVELLTRDEVLHFLYQPGFSTRENVSTVSGRGIGMDVVWKTIEGLKGTIEIETEQGRGTRFLIRLPLTLAILRAILVEAAGITFAVPLSGVSEIIRLFYNDTESVLGGDVIRLRDQVVPLVDLKDALDLDAGVEEKADRAFVVLVGESDRKIGLVVDDLHGEHELVVKPIEDPLVKSPGIAGASILGDGKVVLILNVRELTKRKRRETALAEVPA
jgi:two-component system chemotaxis sensor kinase CheA